MFGAFLARVEAQQNISGASEMKTRLSVLAVAAAAIVAMTTPASSKTFRYANDGDSNSMDPYARNETFLLTFTHNIYEPLVRWNEQVKLEPALATEWSQPSPTVWRFKLRPNVKFHDGAPFSADGGCAAG